MSLRDMPLRSSFISRAIGKCWRLAKLEIEQPLQDKPHYFMGGQMFATLIEQHFNFGGLDGIDPSEAAATAFLVVNKRESYKYTNEQRDKAVARCAEAFEGLLEWLNEWGATILGTEVEIRCKSVRGNDIAIKADLLASKDGLIYLIDVKTFGMWGKSISASEITEEQLRQSVQLALYAYVLERGGHIYINQQIPRTMSNEEVARKFKSIEGSLKPDKVGYVNAAMLTKRRRDSPKGPAGSRRGDPLSVIDYDPSMREYAEEQVHAVELMMMFNTWPRTTRFERGMSTCSGCGYNRDCWGGRTAPVVKSPSWLGRKK
jgi:hypothetical protein